MAEQALLVFGRDATSADVHRRSGGLSLLDRGIRTLARAGAERVVVLLPAAVQPRIHALPETSRAEVQVARWEDDEALPLDARRDALVLMGDHLHHYSSLHSLSAPGRGGEDLVTHVGRRGARSAGWNRGSQAIGVTWEEGELRVGGAVETVLTGAFLCGPGVALGALPGSGRGLLDYLAQRAPDVSVRLREAEEGLWCRVVDRASAAQARRMLFTQVTKKTSGPISRHLNARISIPMSKAIIETGISPHLVTVLLVLPPGLAAAYLIWIGPSFWQLVLAGALGQLAASLDRCDGEIARVKLAESRFGAWFDTVTDNLVYICVVTAILSTIHSTHPDSTLYTYVSVSAMISLVLSMALLYRYAIKTGSGSLQDYQIGFHQHVPDAEKGWLYKALARAAIMAKRDSYSFIFLLGSLTGRVETMYWLLITLIYLMSMGLVISQQKMLAAYPGRQNQANPAAPVPPPTGGILESSQGQ